MKQGIHLGPPLGRAAAAWRAAVAVLALLTAANAIGIWRSQNRVEALRAALNEGEPATPVGDDVEARDRAAAERLRALTASGLVHSYAPTELLALLTRSLPPGLQLTSVSLRPGPPSSSILVEAVAGEALDLTEFQKRLVASPMVAATEVIEERRTASDALAIRLEARLESR